MPPKKKKAVGKKVAKKGRRMTKSVSPTLGVKEGFITHEMTKEQMEDHILRLREELDREREERNYFQLERDKVNTFWEICKQNLEQQKAETRNKERTIEYNEELHQNQVKVYKQKVKHLLYEHQNALTEAKAEHAVTLHQTLEDHRKGENELRTDKQNVKAEIREKQLSHEALMKQVTLKHDKHVTRMRRKYEQDVIDVERKYEKKLTTLRTQLDINRKNEVHEIEERKNEQINLLIESHEAAFSDIRNYYNDITLNNLTLINRLRKKHGELREKNERTEGNISAMRLENKRLKVPYLKALDENKHIKQTLGLYEREKSLMANAMTRLDVTKQKLKDLQWAYDVLKERYNKAQSERDSLYEKYEESLQQVQQRTGLKNLVLEKKLTMLNENLEKKEAQLNEVLSATNLDPAALAAVTKKLEGVLDNKNQAINNLQYELAKVTKAHNDLLRAYDAKFKSMSFHPDSLGFKPLQLHSGNDDVAGEGPAGLVTHPVL